MPLGQRTIVAVVPASGPAAAAGHWVYFDDGTIAGVNPNDGSVFSLARIPPDLDTALKLHQNRDQGGPSRRGR